MQLISGLEMIIRFTSTDSQKGELIVVYPKYKVPNLPETEDHSSLITH